MATKPSHHRILLGYLPHYYVTKRDDRLTRQAKKISTSRHSVRSILSYIVVEELATGGTYVELYPHTTAEPGPSALLTLTYAWSAGKCEPRLCPIGVPSTLWLDYRLLDTSERAYDDEYTEEAKTIQDVCASLAVKLEPYNPNGWHSPVRPQAQMEALMEQAIACVDEITAHNNQFEDYRVALAHACGVWLGLHGQIQGCLYRKGIPGSFDDDMVVATRPLPSDWYARAGAKFPEANRLSEAGWKALRPDSFK